MKSYIILPFTHIPAASALELNVMWERTDGIQRAESAGRHYTSARC